MDNETPMNILHQKGRKVGTKSQLIRIQIGNFRSFDSSLHLLLFRNMPPTIGNAELSTSLTSSKTVKGVLPAFPIHHICYDFFSFFLTMVASLSKLIFSKQQMSKHSRTSNNGCITKTVRTFLKLWIMSPWWWLVVTGGHLRYLTIMYDRAHRGFLLLFTNCV